MHRSFRTLGRQETEKIRVLTERCSCLEKEKERLVQEIKEATEREQFLKCELAATSRKLQLQTEANMETKTVLEQHVYDIWLTKRRVFSQERLFEAFEQSSLENYVLKKEINDVLKALRHLNKSESRLEEVVGDLQRSNQAKATEIENLKTLLERSNFERDEQKRSHSITMREMKLERDVIAIKLQETALQLEELLQQQKTWVYHMQGVNSVDDNLLTHLQGEANTCRHLYQDMRDKTCLHSPGTLYLGDSSYCNQTLNTGELSAQLGAFKEPCISEPPHSINVQHMLQAKIGIFPSVNW
ncbi:hypothetical protein NDU88_004617 [Pleurodeles waltl]|uniref:Uncharacterized protein n=2 Tax=Pleurodeles waltl TaxID=8319 RepID=A0AAV7WYC9_PLEWA|nr:hypothetical protein NDU88_004617 [Pleurodeles waltl]